MQKQVIKTKKRVKKLNIVQGLYRYIYHKLILPLKRERRNPIFLARGTAVGLFFGFSPMFWQMNFVLLFWVIARYFKWRFSLPVGLAWTWVSNGVTNLPLFYLYFVTGQVLLGRETGTFDEFKASFSQGIWEGLKIIFKDWGLSILVGSSLYMITSAIIGYLIVYYYAKYRRNRILKEKTIKTPIK